jgi:hypothetical protein
MLDKEMVAAVKNVHPEEGVYSALIDPGHPFSNFVRGHESRFFPEVTNFPTELEKDTLLFALVDTRSSSNRVVHVGTISGRGLHNDAEGAELEPQERRTGFLSADELVDLGNFTSEEFENYYTKRGVDLGRSISVETNIKVGGSVEKYHGVRTVDLGYLTLVGLIEQNQPDISNTEVKAAVFASINLPQTLSFERVGVDCEPLMGRTDLVTPESRLGRKSTPVAIIYDEHCKEIFSQMGPQLPSVRFEAK